MNKNQQKNDAKLRYHQDGRSANQHRSAHASLKTLKQKIFNLTRNQYEYEGIKVNGKI